MTPVPGSIVTPAGRPLALYVRALPSASVASASSATLAPSARVRSARSVVNTGAWFVALTTRLASTGVPACAASDGVTVTATVSPASPLPTADRSNVSVSALPLVKVRRRTPLTRHSQVRLTGSVSGSDLVAVAVSTSFVPAVVGVSATVALGGALPPTIACVPESEKVKPATGKNSQS